MSWKFNHEATNVWDSIGISRSDAVSYVLADDFEEKFEQGDDKALVITSVTITNVLKRYSDTIPILNWFIVWFVTPGDDKKPSHLIEAIYKILKQYTPEQRRELIESLQYADRLTGNLVEAGVEGLVMKGLEKFAKLLQSFGVDVKVKKVTDAKIELDEGTKKLIEALKSGEPIDELERKLLKKDNDKGKERSNEDEQIH